MAAYQTAFAVALIIIGVGLICVSLIWRRQAETEPPEPDDAGELRTFVNLLSPYRRNGEEFSPAN